MAGYIIEVGLAPYEAVRVAYAIKSSVESSRRFCRETDVKYGDLNNLYRQQIAELRGAHETFLRALRDQGFPMTDADIPDDPIDTAPIELGVD